MVVSKTRQCSGLVTFAWLSCVCCVVMGFAVHGAWAQAPTPPAAPVAPAAAAPASPPSAPTPAAANATTPSPTQLPDLGWRSNWPSAILASERTKKPVFAFIEGTQGIEPGFLSHFAGVLNEANVVAQLTDGFILFRGLPTVADPAELQAVHEIPTAPAKQINLYAPYETSDPAGKSKPVLVVTERQSAAQLLKTLESFTKPEPPPVISAPVVETPGTVVGDDTPPTPPICTAPALIAIRMHGFGFLRSPKSGVSTIAVERYALCPTKEDEAKKVFWIRDCGDSEFVEWYRSLVMEDPEICDLMKERFLWCDIRLSNWAESQMQRQTRREAHINICSIETNDVGNRQNLAYLIKIDRIDKKLSAEEFLKRLKLDSGVPVIQQNRAPKKASGK